VETKTVVINGRKVRYREYKEVWNGVHNLILDYLPKGQNQNQLIKSLENSRNEPGFGSLYIEVERAWGVGATLRVNCNMSWTSHETSDGRKFIQGELSTEVSWSSTGRDLATAQAAVALYQELINLGALVQAAYGDTVGYIVADTVKEVS
jgi:hypothetical protein